MKKIFAMAMTVAVAACGGQQADEPAEGAMESVTEAAAPAENPEAAEPAATQGDAAAGASSATLTEGELLVVTRTADCVEVGPNASDQPWTMGKGSHTKFIAAEGDKTRVTTPTGDACLIASDAVAPD